MDGDVQEIVGLADRSQQDLKNVSMTGGIHHRNTPPPPKENQFHIEKPTLAVWRQQKGP